MIVKVLKNLGVLLFGAALFGSGGLAQTSTQIDANTQIRNWRYTPLNSGVPQGVVNLYTYDNQPILQNLINNANTSGLCNVYLPPGIWYVGSGLDVPTCVNFVGVGFGQGTLFGGPKLGPVIQAMPTFTGPSGYPSNFMARIDGSTTVGAEADTYNARISGITFDCAGVTGCSGLYVGHANEGSGADNSIFANWVDFGEYHCGAGLGGRPYANCGDNGSGPYFNNQLVSYGSWVTSNSYPLVIMSSQGNRPWTNYTINTTAGPVSAGLVQGLGLSLSNIHIENSTNGLVLGPTSGLCASLPVVGDKCLGLQVADIDQVSLSPTGSGYAIVNQNSLSVNITATRSAGQTAGLIQDQVNSVVVPNSYNGEYQIQDNGKCFSPQYCAVFPGPISGQGNLTLQSNTPTITLRDTTTSLYPYHAFSEQSDGQLWIGGSGGDRDVFFTDGSEVISVRSSTSVNFDGANIQSPLHTCSDSLLTVNALFGSNIYYDHTGCTGFIIGNIGGNGYSAAYGAQNGGWGISTSNASQPGTVSTSQFLANTGFFVNNAGHTIVAANAYAASDAGTQMTVIGGITGALTGNASTATALAATPTACAAGSAANGVTATGNASGCLPVDRQWVSASSCTTGSSAGSKCTVNMNWPSAYGGINYSVSCTLIEPVTGAPYLEGVSKVSGSQIAVTISNGQGSQAVASSADAIECTGHAIP